MAAQPGIVQRTEQPYAAIRAVRDPVHTGHPDGLAGATRTLLDWAAQQGLAWDVASTPDGERWGCRLEIYHDEPGQDMSEWETELAFKLTN